MYTSIYGDSPYLARFFSHGHMTTVTTNPSNSHVLRHYVYNHYIHFTTDLKIHGHNDHTIDLVDYVYIKTLLTMLTLTLTIKVNPMLTGGGLGLGISFKKYEGATITFYFLQ